MSEITYQLEPNLPAGEFIGVLKASGLDARRPADNPERIARMLREADLVVTARDDGKLVGISRALTDFSYCCYLSDLAVDVAYQHKGIGKKLIAETHRHAGTKEVMLILLAAPAAVDYYPKIGMQQHNSCWYFPRG